MHFSPTTTIRQLGLAGWSNLRDRRSTGGILLRSGVLSSVRVARDSAEGPRTRQLPKRTSGQRRASLRNGGISGEFCSTSVWPTNWTEPKSDTSPNAVSRGHASVSAPGCRIHRSSNASVFSTTRSPRELKRDVCDEAGPDHGSAVTAAKAGRARSSVAGPSLPASRYRRATSRRMSESACHRDAD